MSLIQSEIELLQSRTVPWPHYFLQEDSHRHRVLIEVLPPDLVAPACRDQYPTGAIILHYSGGGLITVLRPEESELLVRTLTAASADSVAFWSALAGRDVTKIPHRVVKMPAPVPEITLESLGFI